MAVAALERVRGCAEVRDCSEGELCAGGYGRQARFSYAREGSLGLYVGGGE